MQLARSNCTENVAFCKYLAPLNCLEDTVTFAVSFQRALSVVHEALATLNSCCSGQRRFIVSMAP